MPRWSCYDEDEPEDDTPSDWCPTCGDSEKLHTKERSARCLEAWYASQLADMAIEKMRKT